MKKALLILNLGSTAKPSISAVRKYLRIFLMDRRVISLPYWLRCILVYGLIVPFRAAKTAKAYQAIWTAEGSPLVQYGQALKTNLQQALGSDWTLLLGMRYGEPSIHNALANIEDFDALYILPLYPQYSSAATGSAVELVLKELAKRDRIPSIQLLRDFYQAPSYIQALAEQIRPRLDAETHLILSYHGLPERQLAEGACKSQCKAGCSRSSLRYNSCYRAQCEATSKALSSLLGLDREQVSLAYQSRLGKAAWIRPYLEETMAALAKGGVKKLCIASPSFVLDCLETIEELGIRAKADWLRLGGEHFELVPALNSQSQWILDLLGETANLSTLPHAGTGYRSATDPK